MKEIIGSLKERMDAVQNITIDSGGEFCLNITHEGITVSRLMVSIRELNINLFTGESDVELKFLNPIAIGNHSELKYLPENVLQ